jgi:hypothetical protein
LGSLRQQLPSSHPLPTPLILLAKNMWCDSQLRTHLGRYAKCPLCSRSLSLSLSLYLCLSLSHSVQHERL